MKARSDFVTNSSSSSFIVGFNTEKGSIEEQLRNEKTLGKYYDKVLSDIKDNCQYYSLDDAMQEFLESVYYDASSDVYETYEKHIGYKELRQWLNNKDNQKKMYEAIYKEALRKIENFWYKIKDCDCFASVEYSDHGNSELEHEIMPKLSCTLKRISHH